jgi:hypothetical protein
MKRFRSSETKVNNLFIVNTNNVLLGNDCETNHGIDACVIYLRIKI